MNICLIVGISLICASIIVLLRKNSPEFAVPISVVASTMILLISVVASNSLFKQIEEVVMLSSVSSENLKIIFKSLGVCYITQIGKDVCNDCGESSLADKVDLAGKITIAIMSMDIIAQVVTIILEIVNQ